MKKIPIFFTFDDNYVEPAAVAFYSLLNKAKKEVYFEMYVLTSNLLTFRKQVLLDVVNQFTNANLTFIETNGFLQDKWNNSTFSSNEGGSKFTSDAIVRCFSAKFFPQYHKIIYSDVDVIFVDDISELYELPLENKYVAAVRNPFMKYNSYELSHLKDEHYKLLKDTYFAGGIWVLNLEEIRKDNLEEKMMAIIEDKSIIKRWNDQDIMNIACDNKVEYIPLNYISYPYLSELLDRKDFISHYTNKELYDSIINPKIIHFAAKKPWNNNPEYANLWWSIFNFLDLEETKIFDKSKSNINKLKKLKKIVCALVACSLSLLLVFIYYMIKG